MLSLKLATEAEAPAVSALFSELHDNSIYKQVTDYKPEDVEEIVCKLAKDPNIGTTILLYKEEKLIGAIICSTMRQIFNKAEKTAVEIGFWITPEAHSTSALKKLLSAYRYWAKKTGCTSILYGKLKDPGSPESYIVRKLN